MSFIEKFIYFSAPSLCGIKPACLYSVAAMDFYNRYETIISLKNDVIKAGQNIAIIKRSDNLFLFFIYDKKMIISLLSNPQCNGYLKDKGYEIENGSESIIQQLIWKLTTTKEFPHEIGLFLGYPFEDVIGYEKDFGKTSKYSGSWQVYGDVSNACKKMKMFKECEKICSTLYKEGTSISSLKTEYMKISKRERFFSW